MGAEKNFEQKVKQYLEQNGIYRLGATTAESRGYYLKRFGGGQFTPAGLPDMQIVIKGKCLEVELKSDIGRLSELQHQKLEQIKASGGACMVARPSNFELLKQKIQELLET